MAPKTKKRPTPEELLAEVKGKEAAKTYEFEAYLEVIHELQQKGYSYAEIAKFLADRLGIAVSRGQVYRAYQMWRDARDEAEQEAQEAEMSEPPAPMDALEEFEAQAVDAVRGYLAERFPEGDPHVALGHEQILRAALRSLEREHLDDAAADRADQERATKKGGE